MKNQTKTQTALEDVAIERRRQNALWKRVSGKWDLCPHKKLAVLVEEVGEVAADLQSKPVDLRHLRVELIQTAAVCVAWAETLPDD